MDENIKKEIEDKISSDKIVLFMKGTRQKPMCGFSKMAVDVLNHLGVDYTEYNILEYPHLRDEVKNYSSWPTYPQLYVNNELVGGCDIIDEMFESGELETLLKN